MLIYNNTESQKTIVFILILDRYLVNYKINNMGNNLNRKLTVKGRFRIMSLPRLLFTFFGTLFFAKNTLFFIFIIFQTQFDK